MPCAPDLAHPAFAEQGRDFVRTDTRTRTDAHAKDFMRWIQQKDDFPGVGKTEFTKSLEAG